MVHLAGESFIITDNEVAEIKMADKDCTGELTYMMSLFCIAVNG